MQAPSYTDPSDVRISEGPKTFNLPFEHPELFAARNRVAAGEPAYVVRRRPRKPPNTKHLEVPAAIVTEKTPTSVKLLRLI